MTDIVIEKADAIQAPQADAIQAPQAEFADLVLNNNNIARAFPPFVRSRQVRRFQSLDGWRAFAILAVLWQHTLAPSFASPIAREGRHGVTLFFVISGFLIITLLLRSRENRAGFSLWKFWGRRTLRILPIYYTVLAVYILLVHYTDHTSRGVDFAGNLPVFATFTANWFLHQNESTIFFFSWSLAAEEQFYLIWPLVEVLVSSSVLKFILLGAVAVASRLAVIYEDANGTSSLAIHIVAAVPLGITLGAGLAHLLNHEAGFRLAYHVLGRRGSALGCLALAGIVAIVSPALAETGEIMVPFALVLLVASTVIREDNDLARILRWKPIVWIGTVSYGMYLMHMLAVNAVERAAPILQVKSPTVLFLAVVALAIAMASVSFIFYEKRFLIIKDRFFRD